MPTRELGAEARHALWAAAAAYASTAAALALAGALAASGPLRWAAGVTSGQLAWTASVGAIGFAVAAPAAGLGVRRYGTRRVLMAALGVHLVGALALGAGGVVGVWGPVAGGVLLALAGGGIVAAAVELGAPQSSGTRRASLFRLTAAGPAALAGGGLAALALGAEAWPLHIALVAAPALLGIALLAGAAPRPEPSPTGLRAELTSPLVWVALAVGIASAVSAIRWLPTVVQNAGLPPVEWTAALVALAAATRAFAPGRLRLGSPGALAVALAVLAAGLVGTSLSASPLVAVASTLAVAVGAALAWPLITDLVAEREGAQVPWLAVATGLAVATAAFAALPALGAVADAAARAELPENQVGPVLERAAAELESATAASPDAVRAQELARAAAEIRETVTALVEAGGVPASAPRAFRAASDRGVWGPATERAAEIRTHADARGARRALAAAGALAAALAVGAGGLARRRRERGRGTAPS